MKGIEINEFIKLRDIQEGISIFTCCMNRNDNLDRALKTWIKNPDVDEIIIVDWSSDEPVKSLVDQYQDKRIVVARAENQGRWILSHAFNLAARLTTRSKLLKMDADVELSEDFFKFHQLNPGHFFTGNWRLAKTENDLHLNGIIYLYRSDFFKVNGYNEYIKTYGWDDSDLYARLESIGLQKCDLIISKLHHMEHEGRMGHQNSVFDMNIVNEAAYLQFETNKNQYIAQKTPKWSGDFDMVDFEVIQNNINNLVCYQKSEKISQYVVSTELIEAAEIYSLRSLVSGSAGPFKTKISWEISNCMDKDFLIKLYTAINLIESNNKNNNFNSKNYINLVDLAWLFYRLSCFSEMAQYLYHSLKYTDDLPVKNILNWVEIFSDLSECNKVNFDYNKLTDLPEWKALILSTLKYQSTINNKLIQNHINVKNISWEVYDNPKVSIVTSCFKGDQYIDHFLKDITRQTIFEQCELILINPNSPGNEESIIAKYLLKYPNINYIKLEEDPGLYDVWNLGITKARGEYITNANLDDRRSPYHIEKHTKALDENPDIDMVSAPLYVTRNKNENWENNTAYDIWYMGFPSYYDAEDLFLEEYVDGVKTGRIISQNLAHCMPVWRKNLHDKNGYFDELTYGTSCDWEFWLRCSVNGSKYMLLEEPLGLYLEDPKSHNRRFSNKEILENKIVERYCKPLLNNQPVNPHFYGYQQSNVSQFLELNLTTNENENNYSKKINLTTALNTKYGNHRSGWSFVIESLRSLHNDNGIFTDPFIEKKFSWGYDLGDFNNNPEPYEYPWIGFIHNPPKMPNWFQYEQSPQSIFTSVLWQKSIKHCKGIFCLSKYQKQWLENHIDVPVEQLFHPTETPELKFSIDRFIENSDKKIIQIGWWLRKLHSIYFLPTQSLKKTIIKPQNNNNIISMFDIERKEFDLHPNYGNVQTLSPVPNHEYDCLLSENIVYLDLYDSAASNTLVECIVRNTPILVNPIPAVVEYLGEDYPFYFRVRSEAARKAEDLNLIEETYNYLKCHPIKEKLTPEYFVKSLANSQIYLSL